MDDAEEMLLGLLVLGADLILLRRREKSKRWANRNWWVRPINCQRNDQEDYMNLLQEIKLDSVMFFRYTRMTLPLFNNLLERMRAHFGQKKLESFGTGAETRYYS
ncbi:unnamed protein product [Lasius platythorax]|uniref:Uncharacterized protein n=1 Tax=Lasius platythorax TaxID=488582 RepID=A0AAV2NXV0_9HYME